MPGLQIDYNKASILRAQGLSYKEIAQTLGCKWQSLKCGMSAKGLAKTIQQVRLTKIDMANSVHDELFSASKRVKKSLAIDLVQQAQALANSPVTHVSQLGNTPEGQGRASVAKTIAETAEAVFGWNESKGGNLLIMGQLADLEAPAIDVESTPPTAQEE